VIRRSQIVPRAGAVFGERLRGLFAFGSRIMGNARPESDLDLGVWLDGPIRRRNSWVPWVEALGDVEPTLDPTFFTRAALDSPPSWLIEAVHGGVEVWLDVDGSLTRSLDAIRHALHSGDYRRRLFMGLPHYDRAAR
jgi:hypothetical protein